MSSYWCLLPSWPIRHICEPFLSSWRCFLMATLEPRFVGFDLHRHDVIVSTVDAQQTIVLPPHGSSSDACPPGLSGISITLTRLPSKPLPALGRYTIFLPHTLAPSPLLILRKCVGSLGKTIASFALLTANYSVTGICVPTDLCLL